MALDFPLSPTNGQTYNGYVYSTSIGAWQAKPAAQSPFYTSDTPPANPVTGDSWFNTNDGTMYIYVYDGNTYQWVEHRSQIAKSQVGLVPIAPTSIVVGSGTATADTSGNVTFSGVSSLSLNGVFTSAYRNYRILVGHNGGSTDGSELRFQFRAAGTNVTSGYYYSGMRTNAIDGTSGVWSGNNTGSVHYGYDRATATTHALASIDVGAPQISQQTTFNMQSVCYSGTAFANITNSGVQSIDSSHDGFSLVYNTGTHSGFIKVQGYN